MPPATVSASAPAPALPEPVTAIPVTAITSATAFSSGAYPVQAPPQLVTPTSIMPASPGYPGYPGYADTTGQYPGSWRQPVWPAGATHAQPQLAPPQARPQLPATPQRGGVYHTGNYPTVHATQAVHAAVRNLADDAPARSRPPVGVLLLGLLIGLLVFGSTGYLIGSTSNGSTVDGGTAAAGNTTGEGQEAANRRRIGPLLAPLAEGWVPWLGACLSSSEANGPAPQAGEQSRVRCAVNATIDVFFVQFKSAADRDKARVTKQTENASSARIAAGAAPVVAQRAGTSGRTTGAYIEFAYQNEGRTYGGIWWDENVTTTGSAYIEKVWSDGDGGWRPLRDIWQRYT
jgi:hypothetical protein